MNAAILLVTSAWLAGQTPAPPPAKPSAPPPAAMAAPAAPSACCDSGCNTGCDSCCESGGFLARLRGWFHRHDDCCDTCDTCGHQHAAPAPKACCAPAPAPKACCAPAPAPKDCCASTACDDCGCKPGLFDRLRGWFHRHDECCDVCATDCCGSAGALPAPAGAPPEPIKAPKAAEPPKAMPKGSTTGAGLILPQPVLTSPTSLIRNP